jgi:hypothetical protein
MGTVEEVLALWEEAYRLPQRGTLLEDNLHTRWSQAQRSLLEGAPRLCRHRLADLYLDLNPPVEVEVLLRAF